MRRLLLMSVMLFGCAHQPPQPAPHIDQHFVGDVANDHNRDVLSCYQELLPKNPALEGELIVSFRVLPNGDIDSPRVSQGLDLALDKCVLEHAVKWNFPWHKERNTQETLFLSDTFKLKKDGEGVAHCDYKEDTSLDPAEIRKVIREHLKEVRVCYEAALKKTEDINGKLILSWTIDSDGKAVAILAKKPFDKDLDSCIIAAVKTWKFPLPPANKLATVSYPFTFAPK